MKYEKIGNRIKEQRMKLGVSQSELSVKIGVEQSSLSKYENGINMPAIDTLIKLSNVLKCTPNEFLQDYIDFPMRTNRYRSLTFVLDKIPDECMDKAARILQNLNTENQK